jgi:hypothetical protein
MAKIGGHNRGKGKGVQFLRAHVNHIGGECLIWPMGRDRYGYPICGYDGLIYKAHRLMCEFVNGPPPSPEHQAAHSCGNGMGGCVHPQHLRWATPKENGEDMSRMGRCWRKKGSPRRKLTEEQVGQILALKGKMTQYAIAKLFGVQNKHISSIHRGRQWINGKTSSGGFAPGDPRNPFAARNRRNAVP